MFFSTHVRDIFLGLVGLITYRDLLKELWDVHLINFINLGYVVLCIVLLLHKVHNIYLINLNFRDLFVQGT